MRIQMCKFLVEDRGIRHTENYKRRSDAVYLSRSVHQNLRKNNSAEDKAFRHVTVGIRSGVHHKILGSDFTFIFGKFRSAFCRDCTGVPTAIDNSGSIETI